MLTSKRAVLWSALALLIILAFVVSLRQHSRVLHRVSVPVKQKRYLSPVSDQLAFPPDGGGVPGEQRYVSQDVDKKVIRSAQLALVVTNVGEATAKLRALVTLAHGEIDQVREWSPWEESHEGELHVRVPADELESVLKQLKGVAARVTNEQVSASDVTRQYADSAARMRSLQAQEQQYLVILKQAKSVKDVLEVTEKLDEVRSQIERLQTGINVMSHDIAMSAISISLTQNAPEGRLFGSWHPLLHARRSLRSMLESLGDWIDAMVSFAIYLPVIALWGLTIGGVLWVIWRIVRIFRSRSMPVRTAV